MDILIKNGKIVDPGQKTKKINDILIEKGVVKKIAKDIKTKAKTVIDAEGKIVAPGFIDMHTHLREPGREDIETCATALKAAIAGGFTTVCAMPNTQPACDRQSHVQFLLERAKEIKLANIIPIGTITKGRDGKEIAEMGELKKAGCQAVSDDGDYVQDANLMRKSLEYASMIDLVVISHCEDKTLAGNGVMNEGYYSTVLGLPPIPREAESTIVDRDIQLARLADAKLHIAHVSTAESVEIIRAAKKKGVKVTAEVTPHHLALTDEDVKKYDTNMKVNPPLRTKDDVKALKKGLKDGTIDVIATDHAPHLDNEKEKEFDHAPFGMIGLETALPVTILTLVEEGVLDWAGLVEKLSTNPSKILGCAGGTLTVGAKADITIFDPKEEWVYEKEKIVSKANNSPFLGSKMKGKITNVIVGGKVVL